MIEKMHERTNSFAFKLIFALVSISFVLGGIGTGFLGADNSAVKVNGEEISQQAFNSAKSRQQNMLNAQLGERFWDLLDTPEYAKQFHNDILNRLINDELLRQYAKDLKLGISAEQIKKEIVNTPAFQQDGKFSNELYQQTLRSNAISPDQYASIVYEGMLFAQIQQAILDSHFVTPVEQALLAKLLLQKRYVRLANYSIEKEAEQQKASEEELQNYYQTHKNTLINPEKLTVEYVVITPKDLEAKIAVTPEQIETYYQTNKAQYQTKGEAHIAHIQVSDQNVANELAQQLKNGEDFASLAKEKSIDSLSAKQGGDLGWAKAGTFPTEFEKAFAELNAGQVSDVVKVDNAYHIIKVLERKNESIIPLEKVKAQITQIIRNELLATEYSNTAREMANKAFENSGSLAPVAEVAGLSVKTSPSFSRNEIPAELNNDKVLKVLFDSEIKQNGQNSEAIDLSTGDEAKTVFLRVSQYQAQTNKTFEQAKDEVTKAVKLEKAEKTLIQRAENTIKALNEGKTENVPFAPEIELVFAQSQMANPLLTETIFSLPKPTNDKSSYGVSKDNGNIVLIALDKVVDGKANEFKLLAPQINSLDISNLRSSLLQDLREKAKIELNQDFIEQLEQTK